MDPTVAFLSNGRLFIKQPDRELREIESTFAQQSLERQAKQQRLHGWKSRSGVWGSMGMAPPEWSQWDDAGEMGRRAIQIRCICAGSAAGELYYLLDLGDVVGVFRYQLATDSEYRLMHRNAFPATYLSCAADGELVVSVRREDGTIGLAFSQDEGRHWNHVVGGDGRDEAPSWVSGQRRVVYQTAQVGRNSQGFPVGQSEYALEVLDLRDGEPKLLMETTDSDLLMPKLAADESLYYVRRPYRPHAQQEVKPLSLLVDMVMFPFRFGRAVFHYLNFYSMMYSGKPLATSVQQNPWQDRQQRMLMLWGHMVDTKKHLSQSGELTEQDLVPKEWQLWRRAADGSDEVVAEHVLAYDVAQDGTVIFTNGTTVWSRSAQGEVHELCRGKFIEAVTAVPV